MLRVLACLLCTVFSNAVNTFNDHHRTLAEQLLHDIGRGNTCVHRTVALARSATIQEPTAALTKLASLFTDTGKNSERDLHNWIGTQAWGKLIPPTFDFLVDYANMSPCGLLPGETTHSCLLPHELFHSVHTTSPCLFRHLFTGSDTELTDWWRAAATTDSDWYTKHPVVAACGRNPLKMVPYGIHGDDGGVAGGNQVLALTWGSVVRQMATLDTRLAFTMIRVQDIAPQTLHTVYSVMLWSFEALAVGTFPYNDHAGRPFSHTYHPMRFKMRGKPLAGGITGAFCELRGDWKFLKEVLQLVEHYNGVDRICHLCKVRKFADGMRYTNFQRDAPHRDTTINNTDWLLKYLAAAAISPLLLIPGFHIWKAHFDSMHCIDLGIYQVMVPSVMKVLARKRAWAGRTIKQRYEGAYVAYKGW